MEIKEIGKLKICGYPEEPYFANLESKHVTDFYLQVLERLIKPGATIVDVGANIGVTAMMAHHSVPNCSVIAIEPSPRAFDALQATIRANPGCNVTALNHAVSDKSAKLHFAQDSNLSASHLHPNGGPGIIEVQGERLDDTIARLGLTHVDLVKIDVEGFEYGVLEGMKETLERFNPLVFMEFNSFTLSAFGRIAPGNLLEYVLNNFDGVYYMDGSGQFKKMDDWLGFLAGNMIHHGCVDDILMMNYTPKAASKLQPSTAHDVANASDCDFYHSLNIPGHGEVKGQWDLRGNELAYLGGIDLRGKSVLEIGPASGYLTFWMEGQGADVTALDLSEDHKWDFVPFHGMDMEALNAARKTHLQRLHNSWWFTRRAFNANANIIYGTVYDIDPSLGNFDIVTLSSILLHLRDPFRALEKAASVCSKTIVISDVAEEQFFGNEPEMWNKTTMFMLPRSETKSPVDAWYFIPSITIVEILKILGFSKTTVTKHSQNFMTGPWKYYTVVGERP